MEAIILAGGLGTRLRNVISDLPKPMAPVNNRPFLKYVLDYLKKNNVNKVILATGYLHDKIESYFGSSYNNISIVYSIEKEPLGTGGGLKQAFRLVTEKNVFLLNGDTFFDVDLNELYEKHFLMDSDLTLSLKPMTNFERYGNVLISNHRVIEFQEKQFIRSGYINGGVYVAKSDLFNKLKLPNKFSFETDFMRKNLQTLRIYAFISDSYFIDIGIPSDYERAQREFSKA